MNNDLEQPKKREKYRKAITIISILVVLILVIGTFLYLSPRRALSLVVPDVNSINRIKVSIKNDTAYINLELILENKAPYSIDIDSIQYTIQLDTATIVQEHQPLKLEQASGAIDTANIIVHLPIKKMQGTIRSMQSADSTYLSGQFRVVYSTMLGKMSMEYAKKIKIRVPVHPKITFESLEREKIKLLKSEALVNVNLSVTNNSPVIDLVLSDLYYSVNLGENIFGTGVRPEKVVIKPSSTAIVTLPLKLDVSEPVRTGWNILVKKKEMAYFLTLKANISNDDIEQTPIEFQMSGTTRLLK